MAAKNIYANSLVSVPIVIPNGDNSSPFVDCAALTGFPNLAGSAQLMSIIVDSAFPSTTLSFETKQSVGDSPALVGLADGKYLATLGIPYTTGNRMQIVLEPYWLLSARYIRLVSSFAMSANTTVVFVFQPVIQSIA